MGVAYLRNPRLVVNWNLHRFYTWSFMGIDGLWNYILVEGGEFKWNSPKIAMTLRGRWARWRVRYVWRIRRLYCCRRGRVCWWVMLLRWVVLLRVLFLALIFRNRIPLLGSWRDRFPETLARYNRVWYFCGVFSWSDQFFDVSVGEDFEFHELLGEFDYIFSMFSQ